MDSARTTGWPADARRTRTAPRATTGLGWPEPGTTRQASSRVVAGIDGSPGSLATLRRAMAQARLRHAALEVVKAIPENASTGTVAGARAMLDRIIAREYPEGLTVPVRLRVERGEPAQVLVRASTGADLLVLSEEPGPGDQGGSGDILRRVLRTVSCPVDNCAADAPRS